MGATGAKLAARLELPTFKPRAYALFAHCFTCSKDIFAATRISRALAERGIAVLRFDFTGLGSSEGEFAHTNFSSNVEDLVAAADFLREHYQAPQLLIGHSLGGAAVIAARERIPEVKAVATLNAPSDPAHVKHLFGEQSEEIEQQGAAWVTLAGRRFCIKKHFLVDVAQNSLLGHLSKLRAALLVLHAPLDEIVGVDNARTLFDAAKHPKSFVSLDDADHLLTRKLDAQYAASVIATWAERYVPAAVLPGPEHGEVWVTEEGTGKFIQRVNIGQHTWIADEPKEFGGNDAGPGPYDWLLAGLGACTSMTLRMYANHKQLDLKGIVVRLSHEKIHAKDCEDCETKQGKLDRIVREIQLEGDLSPEARQRLLEIADRCPVHRTLHSEVVIQTRERKSR